MSVSRLARALARRYGVPVAVAVPILLGGLVAGNGTWPLPVGEDPAAVTAVPHSGRLGGDVPDVPGAEDPTTGASGAHPVTYPVGTSAVRSAIDVRPAAKPDTSDTALPARVLRAYEHAASSLRRSDTGCHLSWPLLAGIGKVESGHAYGGEVDQHGDTLVPILGPVLDGGPGVAAIPDTDDGRWDTDRTWDRAVGPMQFIPSSWSIHGADGNDDGRRDPNNVVDAALASGGYLCSGDRDVRVQKQRRAAVYSYNHSWDYVDLVLAWADAYAGGTPVLTGSLGALADGAGRDAGGRSARSGPGSGSGGDGTGSDVGIGTPTATSVPTSAPPSAAPVTEPSASPSSAVPTDSASAAPEPSPSPTAEPTRTPEPSPTCTTAEPTPTESGSATPSDSASPSVSPDPSPSPSESPSESPSPGPTPTCG